MTKTRVREPLRRKLTLIPVSLALVAGVAAALLAPPFGMAAGLGAAVVGAVVVGAASWYASGALAQAVAASSEVAEGRLAAEDYPLLPGELATVSEAMHGLGARIKGILHDYRTDVAGVAHALVALNDPKVDPRPPTLTDHSREAAEPLRMAFADLKAGVVSTRNQHALAIRILNGLPEPVLATDGLGLIRFANKAAERAVGREARGMIKKSISFLFQKPGPDEMAGDDPAPVAVGPPQVLAWAKGATRGRLHARATGEGNPLLELTGTTTRTAPQEVLICIIGRDLTEPLRLEANDRGTIRANASKRLLDRYLNETGEALGQIDAQLRLLTGEAKQSARRDAMVPKLAVAGQALRQVETYHLLAHWFRTLMWAGDVVSIPSEFMASEVANVSGDRLIGRFKARGNRLKVVDQGGWLFADSERLEVALTGLLVHACDATSNHVVEVRIARIPVGPERPAPVIEYHVVDAGPALDFEMLAAIQRPFGGLAPAPFDRFDGLGGFPMALAVAAGLAQAMGGTLRIESGIGEVLGLRLTIPTRLGSEDSSASSSPSARQVDEVAPLEETVAGWRLGVPATSASSAY